MTKAISAFLVTSMIICLAGCHAPPVKTQADVVFTNGKIFTVDQDQPFAEAMAINNGKILALGGQPAVAHLIGPSTRTIDLAGGTVLPGLVDGHLHPVRGAIKGLYDCTFPFSANPKQIQQAVANCVEQQPDDAWIVGGQWDSGFFTRFKIESPKAFLDQVSGDKAILLRDDSLHNIWVNSRALELAGFNRNTPNPGSGTIVRGPDGEPNGILLETAARVISNLRPRYDDAKQKAAVVKFVQDANAFGLTGAKSASSYSYELKAIQAVDLDGGLSLHMAASIRSVDGKRDQPLDYASFELMRDKYKAPHFDTRFVKIFLDGVPTPARTAAMLSPYVADQSHSQGFDGGELLVDPQTLAEDLIELDKRGFTVKMHTAGDRSVRIALDAIEAARKANGDSGLRHELAHAGYIDQDDIPRFGKLNAVADLSPILWYPSPIIDAIYSAVGEARGQHYFPVRDLIDSGANLLAGSDWPAVSVNANPWVGIESLVTRQHPHEKTHGALWPEQAITLEEAIRIYSLEGARALRKDHMTGSLELGKSADFVVLQENLFEIPVTQISEILPLETWFEGRQVYRRQSSN